MVNGKAQLLREDYCDGLGDCLPACPTNAISFEEREAPAYDEAAVQAAKAQKANTLPCGCPGSHNNQMLAFANTIEACATGVSMLDATMNGMGRGAGREVLGCVLMFAAIILAQLPDRKKQEEIKEAAS